MSVDNYILRAPDRLYYKNGRSDSSWMFLCVFLFVDHVSCFIIINNQVDINATENVNLKLTFEREFQSNLVVMKGNKNYNGLFNASDFIV